MRHRATRSAERSGSVQLDGGHRKYDLSLDVDIKRKFDTCTMYVPIVALKHDWDWTILSERMCMKDVVAYHEVHAPLQWDILSVHISLSDVLKILICHGITLPYPHASIYIQNSSIVYQINHGHRT
jgi:hypothetical protein